jgi:carboxylate-amine ligase
MLVAEYESGDRMPFPANREIEGNKWSAQRYGLGGVFLDHETGETVEARTAVEALVARLSETTSRDLSVLEGALDEPTESVRQVEVWRETGSTFEVTRDIVDRVSKP